MTASGLTIVEIPSGREIYSGDKRAINRHSVRRYVDSNGGEYTLDRALDVVPPSFTLWCFPTFRHGLVPSLGNAVPVNGHTYWGGDLSWQRAEQTAFEAIEALGA